jgi:hypothetical protein
MDYTSIAFSERLIEAGVDASSAGGYRRWGGVGGWRVGLSIDEGQPCLGEDLDAHVAALFGPFVGLLGQHGADEADDRCPVGEDADHVGAAADLLVQPLF